MKFLRFAGVLLGAGMLTVLIREVGLSTIRHTLGLLGWGYVLVLTYPITWTVLNTWGWRWACSSHVRQPSWWTLLRLRMAGESFNSLLPAGYLGGEPLKAKLLARWMPLRQSTSSVLIAKAAQSVAMVVFLGFGLTLAHTEGTSPLREPKVLWALGLLVLGIGIFVWLLAHGSFSRLARLLHRWTGHPWLGVQETRLRALDDTLGAFYRQESRRFAASVLWHTGAWLLDAWEVALIFWLIGRPIDWRQAWFMAAMGQLGAVIGLFIPAGLGMFEGGHYVAARVLGLPPSLGLSVSLIRRVREGAWDLFGLGFFWELTKSGKGKAPTLQAGSATAADAPGRWTGTS